MNEFTGDNMKKSTFEFIKNRKNAEIVNVKTIYHKAARHNMCVQNCFNFTKKNSRYISVSGWIIGDEFEDSGTAIIPHYWLQNVITKEYFDPTPQLHPQQWDYVLDSEVFRKARKNKYVPAPLNFGADEIFRAVTKNIEFVEIPDLEITRLYALAW